METTTSNTFLKECCFTKHTREKHMATKTLKAKKHYFVWFWETCIAYFQKAKTL